MSSYTEWRIQYQDSEQAARAAFAHWAELVGSLAAVSFVRDSIAGKLNEAEHSRDAISAELAATQRRLGQTETFLRAEEKTSEKLRDAARVLSKRIQQLEANSPSPVAALTTVVCYLPAQSMEGVRAQMQKIEMEFPGMRITFHISPSLGGDNLK